MELESSQNKNSWSAFSDAQSPMIRQQSQDNSVPFQVAYQHEVSLTVRSQTTTNKDKKWETYI